MGLQ
ncbi:hypothetical protein AB3S75_008126, partial [Citrus x aurantiifolia]|jgi:hypothetical protein